jgi:hypothetical protein
MSMGSICFALSAFLFLLLGFDVINSTGKVDLVLVAAGLVPLGLLLSGWVIPINFNRSQ